MQEIINSFNIVSISVYKTVTTNQLLVPHQFM